jgi:hypothetical protein
VAPRDPAALAEALRRVTTDGRFLAGAIRAGRALKERLAPEAVAAQFEAIYGGVLSRGSRS